MQKKKLGRVIKFDVRALEEELKIVDERANQQKLSRSRYLIEAGLSVKGVADWRERAKREQSIFELRRATHSFEIICAKKPIPEREELLTSLAELKVRMAQLLNFYTTDTVVPENEFYLNQPNNSRLASYDLTDYAQNQYTDNSQSVSGQQLKFKLGVKFYGK